MFTATADLMLPSTVTGSWPRPRWFDVSMWGEPLDTCMMDVRFREKIQDALAVVISDERLGETIAIRQMVYLALTYDHRLVDGADAARFLTAVKQRLEEANFESELG